MARIEHPVGVFSGACTRSFAEIVREFIRGKWSRGEEGDGGTERGGQGGGGGRYFLKT